MGILGKFMDGLKRGPQDEEDNYFLDEDYEDDYEEDEDEEESDAPSNLSIFSKFSQSSNGTTKEKSSGFSFTRRGAQSDNGGMEVSLIKPSSMDDSKVICDYLLDGKAVVLNMEGINTDTAQRIIDFTLGAIYSMDGDLQMISKYIFIASPRNVELSGDFQSDFQNMVSQKTVTTRSFGMNFNG